MNKMTKRLISFQALKGYSVKKIDKIIDGKFKIEFEFDCDSVGSIFEYLEMATYKSFPAIIPSYKGDDLSITWTLDIEGVPFDVNMDNCKCWLVYK